MALADIIAPRVSSVGKTVTNYDVSPASNGRTGVHSFGAYGRNLKRPGR